MRPLLLACLLLCPPALAQRKLLSAPAPLGGAFNKAVPMGTWTIQQIGYINQFTVTNVGTATQTVKVTALVESLTWAEYNDTGTSNAMPVPGQTAFHGFGGASGSGTWDSTEHRYEYAIATKTIAPGLASTFDSVLYYKGPVTDPAVLPHVLATASIRYLVEITEDRGAITAAHRIFGNNGFGGLQEDSNMQNLSPVFYAINGGRPF